MAEQHFRVSVQLEIAVTLDDEVVRRCVENLDDAGQPQPDERGSRGWRNIYYDLHTPERVAEHMAYNLAIRGASLSSLDGWADLADDLAAARVIDSDYEARRALARDGLLRGPGATS